MQFTGATEKFHISDIHALDKIATIFDRVRPCNRMYYSLLPKAAYSLRLVCGRLVVRSPASSNKRHQSLKFCCAAYRSTHMS